MLKRRLNKPVKWLPLFDQLNGRFWSIAGAQFDEIIATLPTFQGIAEGRVWRRHFDKLADSSVSFGVTELRNADFPGH